MRVCTGHGHVPIYYKTWHTVLGYEGNDSDTAV